MITDPRRLGKYELRERLGRGGMAEVWKAFDIQLERYVAIKLLHADLQNDPNFMQRFIREARVVASLHHPNIVQVHDFQTALSETSTGTPTAYMVMDYVQGQTLNEYISNTSRVGNFPPASEILHLFACISSAIDYAHQRGMIHRDIKPANILLDQRSPSRYHVGHPILTDFGIVKLLGASNNTLSGWWMGTPLYISPEQAQGQPGNERSDIYSLGVILYEIWTGVQPFQGDSMVAIIRQHIDTMPTSPELINPEITSALADVIMCSLAKDPAARFLTASSMTAAMAEALGISTPANLHLPPSTTNTMDEPTYISSPSPEPTDEPGGPTTPLNSISATSEARLIAPTADKSATAPPLHPPTRAQVPGRRGAIQFLTHISIFVALLILIVGSSSLGAFYLLSHRGTGTTSASNQIVGYATFVDSGQLNDTNSQGINDELQINLQDIPAPATGKSYYGWLLSDTDQQPMTSLFLGKLSVNKGSIHFLYPGNAQHSNLLATTSRFLITVGADLSGPSPIDRPSSDRHTWRYYTELPQTGNTTNPTKGFSMLDELRHLLAGNPTSTVSMISGGLAIWLLRNTQRVLEEADSARDAWISAQNSRDSAQNSRDAASIHSHIIRALDYLDGAVLVQQDVPPATPLLVDQNLLQAPLFDIVPDPSPSSYLSQTDRTLQHLIEAPGITPGKIKLAHQTDLVLINAQSWFKQAHDDARKLFSMTATQLLSQEALSILNDMVTQASYAYDGQIDPFTGKVQQEGIRQVYADIQRLAAFDVRPYTSA